MTGISAMVRSGSIDSSGDDILVNLAASNGETHPSRALLLNFDGNQEDLTDYEPHV